MSTEDERRGTEQLFAILAVKCSNKKSTTIIESLLCAHCQVLIFPVTWCALCDCRLKSSFISATFKNYTLKYFLLYCFAFLLRRNCLLHLSFFSWILLSLKSLSLFNRAGFFDPVFQISFYIFSSMSCFVLLSLVCPLAPNALMFLYWAVRLFPARTYWIFSSG